jgi:hypothetical protein
VLRECAVGQGSALATDAVLGQDFQEIEKREHASQLLKKTFDIDTVCPRCKTPLRLIAMIETCDTIKKILKAMGLPCSFGALGLPTLPLPRAAAPRPSPVRPSPGPHGRHPRNLVARVETG